MQWGSGVVVAGLVALALAGCTGGQDPPTASTSDPFAGITDDVEVAEGKGAIAGIIVDAAVRPIGNATVAMVGRAGNATTDGQGRFVFEDLEPGAYFLQASARRHESAQVSVDVVAGQATPVRILLVASTSAEPYHTTLQFRGHTDAWLGFVSFAAEVVAPGALGCTCAFNITPDPGAVGFTYEVTGQPDIDYSTAPVYGNLYWEFIGDQLGDHQDIRSAHGTFPVYQTFDRDSFDNETTTWTARVTPSQYPHVTFDFDLYVTVWYHEPAPEGWSFVAGDT